MPQHYDIIGDIHGRASALNQLLAQLGYERSGSLWSHLDDRHLIFLGDFIDVGSQQRKTLTTIRELLDCGMAQAIMGNHEFNAICYATLDDSGSGDFLRTHHGSWGASNQQQHQAFLREFDPISPAYQEWINWMLQLPLWVETECLRVVHACWDQQAIERLSPRLLNRRLTIGQFNEANDPTSAFGSDVALLLKGPELQLPPGSTFSDRSGHLRDHVRRAWWRTQASTYGDAVLLPSDSDLPLWQTPLPSELASDYTESKPTFFGHYCLSGTPPLVGKRTACLDTCAARGHRLTAYRWDGEMDLTAAHLVSVPAITPRA